MDTDITTEDGVIVHKGDVVFNYYDRFWGTIVTDPDDQGWFDVQGEFEKRYLNGSRIATFDPNGTEPPASLTTQESAP